MKKLLEKLVCKYIVKILTIYKNYVEKFMFKGENYLDDKIYFETEFLIRLIKERRK